jgi:hypothetical protein
LLSEGSLTLLLAFCANQAAENIKDILVSCVVAKEVWFIVSQKVGLQALVPDKGCLVFLHGGAVQSKGCEQAA